MTHLYNCKTEIDSDGQTVHRITKFDSDMNVESSYRTDGITCECPAGPRDTCRHREMLPSFLARGFVNTHWFYDFDRGGWVSMGTPEPPAGIQMFDLSKMSPEQLFNTIADAVGEPRASKLNRRGY